MRLLAAALLLSGLVVAVPAAEPSADDSPPFSASTLELERKSTSLLSPALRKRTSAGQLFSVNSGNSFLTNIKFGNQTFKVVVDTGSSDTWLIGAGFTCLDANGNEVSEAACDFGNVYKYQQDPTLVQGAQEQQQNFMLAYGDGEQLVGVLATDTVDLAGVTFKTEVGVGMTGYWNGDGISSGLVGLAFPQLTSAYVGTNPAQDGASTKTYYDPIMYQLFEDNGYTPAMFSLALSRDNAQSGYGGSLTIGGVPKLSDPKINAAANWAYAPFETTPSISDQYLSYYSITVDSVTFGKGKQTGAPKRQWVIDSGTSLIYAPSKVAQAYNKLWTGQTTYHPKAGEWSVPCDATAPPFSVTIDGKVFNVNPKDLLINFGGGNCRSGILDVLNGDTLLLGDVFLKNVVAAFDWGKQRMGFAPREFYQS